MSPEDKRNRSVKLCQLVYDRKTDSTISYEIRKLLEEGLLIDFQDHNRNKKTAIHLAVEKCDVICVKFLLQFKPSLEVKDENGRTAIELAESHGYQNILNALLNSTVDAVNESYVVVFEFESLTPLKIEAIKSRSTFKVLKLSNCPSVNEAWEKFNDQGYTKALNESSHLFFIAIETNERQIQNDHALMKKVLNFRRPMIIQLSSPTSQQSKIYFKENKKDFVEITDASQINQEEFNDAVESDENCNLNLLVAALRSNLFGHFTGDLLDAKLNTNDVRSKAVNQFAKSNALCHRFFKLFDESPPQIDRIVATLSFKGDQSLLALLDLPFELRDEKLKLNANQQDILSIVDSRDSNLLMVSAKTFNLDAVKLLLRCGCDFNHLDSGDDRASDICWEMKADDCLVELIEAGSPYPYSFCIDELSESTEAHKRINAMIEATNSFHKHIKKGEIEEVKKFIANYPHIKHAFDTQNKCALTLALQSNQVAIYSLLMSSGFEPGADDGYQSACSKSEFKYEIRNSHRKYFKEAFDEPHLKRLLKMFRLSFGSKDRANCSTIIRKMFEELNQIDEVIPILQICSLSDELRIVFDFNCDTVAEMDPISKPNALGAVYPIGGFVYIGAKNHETEFHKVIGALIHELTHYAMELAYGNNIKPYDDDDTESEKRFETIATETKKICDEILSTDSIVATVFSLYKKEVWHAELIVRVPQLLAHYKMNPIALEAAERNTPELFHFYRTKTLKDVETQNKVLFQEYLISKINNQTGIARKIDNLNVKFENDEIELKPLAYVITSNAPYLTLAMLSQGYCDDSHIFVSLEQVAIGNILEKIAKVHAKESSTALIVDCIGLAQKYQKSFRKLLKDIKNIKTIALVMTGAESSIVKENSHELDFKICDHKWSELTESSKVHLLDQNVIFQGVEMKLNELVEPSSEAMNFFPLDELLHCKDFKIGHELHQTSHKFYIPRKFIRKGQVTSWMIPANSKTFKELIEDDPKMGTMIISDEAGSGKSVTLFEIAKSLRDAYPDRWIQFVDLKLHIEAFKSVEECERIESFDDFIAQNILKHKTKFDQELFKQMFRDGKTSVLFDGFDEISPNYKDLLLHVLKLFQPGSGNQLFITTRPHLEADLEGAMGKFVFKLQGFSGENQTRFLREYWQSVGIKMRNEDLEDLSYQLLDKFFDITHSTFIGLPLLMGMTAEIFEDPIKENLSHKVDSLSINSVFRDFVEKYFLRWTKNENEISQSETVEFQMTGGVLEVHRDIAINHILGKKFLSVEVAESDAEKISRVGLIRFDKTAKTFQFIHKTFAEYFVADFICFHLSRKNLKPTHECQLAILILFEVFSGMHDFRVINTFFDQSLKIMKFSPSEAFCESVAKCLCKFIESQNQFNILSRLLSTQNPCENIASLLLSIVKHVEKEVLLKMLQAKTKSYSTTYSVSHGNVLFHAAAHGSNAIVSTLCEIITTCTDNPKEIYQNDNQKLKNVLLTATHNKNGGVLTTLCANANLNSLFTKDEIRTIFQRNDEFSENFIATAAHNSTDEVFLELISLLPKYLSPDEIKTLCLEADGSDQNFLHQAFNYNTNKSLKLMFEVVRSNFSIAEQKTFFHQSADAPNMFFCAALNHNEKIFETIIESTCDVLSNDEIKSMLMQKDSEGSNVLHIIADRGSETALNGLNSLLRERLSEDEIRSMLFEVNCKRQNYPNDRIGQNCFRLAANSYHINFQLFCETIGNLLPTESQARLLQQSSHEIDIIRLTCGNYTNEFVPVDEIKDLLTKNDTGMYDRSGNVFQEAASRGKVDRWNKLISFAKARFPVDEMKSFLFSCNKDGQNCLHGAVLQSQYHVNMIEEIFKTIKTVGLSVDDQKIFFRQIDSAGRNVFHSAATRPDTSKWCYLYDGLSAILSKNEMKEMLKAKDFCGDNILGSKRNLSNGFNNGLICRSIGVMRQLLTSDEMKNLLLEVNSEGRNIFQYAVEHYSADDIKSLSKAIKENLNQNDQKMFFGTKSFFYLAARNPHNLIFSTTHECLKDILTKNEIKALIQEKDSKNKNLLHFLCQHDAWCYSKKWLRDFFEVLKVVCDADELKNFLTSSDDNGRNCLLLAAPFKDKSILMELFSFIRSELSIDDQQNLIEKCDNDGKNIFTFAVISSEGGIFSTLHERFKDVLTDTEIRSLIQVKNPFNQNVLHMICVDRHSCYFETKLIDLLKVLKVVCNADELKQILTSSDKNGSNCLHLAAQFTYSLFLKKLFSFIRSELSSEDQRILFQKCDSEDRTIFMCSAKNRNNLIFSTVHECFKDVLTGTEMKSLIQQKDSDNRNVFQLICLMVIKHGAYDRLREFLKVLKGVCDADELNVIFTSTDNHGFNCLHLAAFFNDQFLLEELFEFIRSELSVEDQRNLFKKCDNDGRNIFTFSPNRNGRQEIYSLVEQFAKEILSQNQIEEMKNKTVSRGFICSWGPDYRMLLIFDN